MWERVRRGWARRREGWPYVVRWQRPRRSAGRVVAGGYYWTRRWTPENGGRFRVVRYAMRFGLREWWRWQWLEIAAASLGRDPQWLENALGRTREEAERDRG